MWEEFGRVRTGVDTLSASRRYKTCLFREDIIAFMPSCSDGRENYSDCSY